ncbi:MBL fold metallo-hydrolase [Zhihengliuella somnathii]
MTQEPTETGWQRVGERTYVLTLDAFKINIGLVVGDKKAVLIDSGAGPREAAQILSAVREVTDLPLAVVNTHSHGDHTFGNAYLAAHGVEEFWAHSATVEAIAADPAAQRRMVARTEPEMAAGEGEYTAVHTPTNTVGAEPVDLDLGSHSVTLFHLGRGHTAGDLLVGSGAVLFAGDLVEEGAHPEFEDSFPYDWRKTLGKIIAIDELYTSIVPGHGRIVDADYVRSQLNNLRQAIRLCTTAIHEASVDYTKAVPVLPYGPIQSRYLITRLKETETASDTVLPH